MQLIHKRFVLPAIIGVACMGFLTACSEAGQAEVPTAPSSPPSTPAEPSTPPSDLSTGNTNADDKDVVANPPSKSMHDALDAARAEFSGDVIKIELEREDDERLEYKVVLVSSDMKYVVEFDANTLEKFYEKEVSLGDEATQVRKNTFDLKSVIDVTKAAEVARKQQDGTITEWELQGKDAGLVQYEFEILPAGASDDIEIKIDAIDGTLISGS